MSRIGKLPVQVPDGVSVSVGDDNVVAVKGPKGQLTQKIHKDMRVSVEGNLIKVERPNDSKPQKSLHGLSRALIQNMVDGVTKGYEKTLVINGVGYRAQKQGKKLVLTVGYSHPVEVPEENGVEFEVPAANRIIVRGMDKQAVGEMAAKVRRIREPEPYKGKGIKYENERILRKEGKAGKK